MKLDYAIDKNALCIALCGDCLDYDDDTTKENLYKELRKPSVKEITVNAEKLGKWDSTLVVILFEVLKIAQQKKIAPDFSSLPENLQKLIHLASLVDRKPEKNTAPKNPFLEKIGDWTLNTIAVIKKGLMFIKSVMQSLGRLISSNAVMRKVDFMFALEDSSYKAVGIVSLVSFMIGLILAFVGAIQLKTFGAQIYVASLVAIGMTRIMGAIMVGVIMAGRTGASYAATIGTMQVNEEVDALKTMGIPTTDFLVLPRIVALTITIPFLTILADFMGILGGAAVGVLMLDIAPQEYWKYSIDALDLTNFFVGLFHAFVFGIVISLCGCYYGIYCGRNADSVGKATTQAVVSAIVWMIVMTGIITMLLEVMGI